MASSTAFNPVTFDTTHTVAPPKVMRNLTPTLSGNFENVSLVGVNDYAETHFHGVPIDGTAYGSFLIDAGEHGLVLIDGVKQSYTDNLIANIRAAAGDDALSKITHVVSLHSELDHSGALPFIMAQCPSATLHCGAKCHSALVRFHPAVAMLPEDRVDIYKNNGVLELGDYKLTFVLAPLLHWSDSTVAILTHIASEETVLFSSDIFGAHVPTPHRFVDEYVASASREALVEEIIKYSASIVGPYLRQQLKRFLPSRFDKIENLQAICPAHGPAYRTKEDIAFIRAAAETLTDNHRVPGKVAVFYSSMYGGAGQIASNIATGLERRGACPVLIDVENSHEMVWSRHSFDMAGAVFATATLNKQAMPHMVGLLAYLDGLTFLKNTPTWVAATYGWDKKAAVKQMSAMLNSAGASVENEETPVTLNWHGTFEEMNELDALAEAIAAKVM